MSVLPIAMLLHITISENPSPPDRPNNNEKRLCNTTYTDASLMSCYGQW